ncbi:MAG: serine--tRNA ligase [Candidatus Levybacteria bacterium]|nr:serine--tRNA ligase [Candidatus Levybacteria bacterium]
MIDIKLLRDNPQFIENAAKDKGVTINVSHIIEIADKQKELSLAVQTLREERNRLAKSVSQATDHERESVIDEGKKIKVLLEQKEHALSAVEEELRTALLLIPNPAKRDVKVGKDETGNDVIRKFKEPTNFSFTPKDHLVLGESLDIIDTQRAAKVSGARFAYLKNEAVLLEFALVQHAMNFLIKEGFSPIIPPVLIKQDITEGLGYWQSGGNEDYYLVSDFNVDIDPDKPASNPLYLVGTSEHALVPMHKDEILQSKDLPKRYVGFSPAFRREAGSYGKDTKGIIRVHQFDKIEMVSFVEHDKDDQEHEYLLSIEEKLFQSLQIPYQVVKMCTGDLGFPAARKYDLEAWIPSQKKYREVTSVSTVTDFQSRRLNIKYRNGDKTEYASILNGTAFAIGRTIVAILENYQQEDGSVIVPEVLRAYVGKDKITPRT